MKRAIYTFLALLSLTIVTQASAKGFSYGVRGGMTISNLSNGDLLAGMMSSELEIPVNDVAKVGFTAGVFGEYTMLNKVSLSASVMYARAGCSFEPIDELDNIRLATSYLSIPLLVGYNVFGGLTIKGGVQPSFMVGAKLKYDGESESVKDSFNKSDLSIPIGFSYEFADKVVLEALYNIGVTNVYKYTDETYSNRYLTLTVGYKF